MCGFVSERFRNYLGDRKQYANVLILNIAFWCASRSLPGVVVVQSMYQLSIFNLDIKENVVNGFFVIVGIEHMSSIFWQY